MAQSIASTFLPFPNPSVQTLRWSQPQALRQRFELRADDQVLAALTWQNALKLSATLETAAGRWRLKRQGFWHLWISALPEDNTKLPIRFDYHWFGGRFTLPNHQVYSWHPTSFWGTKWVLEDANQTRLLQFDIEYRFTRSGAQVQIEPQAESLPDLAVVMGLCWYILVLYSWDTVALAPAVGV